MRYTVFNTQANNHLDEFMFLGKPVGVARYDIQRHPFFDRLLEKQLSFFWRPEEIDLSRDRIDFLELSEHEKHIFVSNLKYQTLLDSIQGRSPNTVLLPIVSLPELESWIEWWSASEVIHSKSYTHIIRNIFSNPSEVFDDILVNEHILKRAKDTSKYYDDLYQSVIEFNQSNEVTYDLAKKLYLCLISINVLEAIRFYVSFACSFAFAERKLMEGNAKVIKLISRDEQLHMTGTQHIINTIHQGLDHPLLKQVADDCYHEAREIFKDTIIQEKQWAEYLFKDGSMIGLNKDILCQYIEYIANTRMSAIGFEPLYNKTSNPISWINNWLVSDNVQVAPQETEITSYLVNQVDNQISDDDFNDFSL